MTPVTAPDRLMPTWLRNPSFTGVLPGIQQLTTTSRVQQLASPHTGVTQLTATHASVGYGGGHGGGHGGHGWHGGHGFSRGWRQRAGGFYGYNPFWEDEPYYRPPDTTIINQPVFAGPVVAPPQYTKQSFAGYGPGGPRPHSNPEEQHRHHKQQSIEGTDSPVSTLPWQAVSTTPYMPTQFQGSPSVPVTGPLFQPGQGPRGGAPTDPSRGGDRQSSFSGSSPVIAPERWTVGWMK